MMVTPAQKSVSGTVVGRRLHGVLEQRNRDLGVLWHHGILTGSDPLAVADSIYAVVVFNGLVLFLMISLCDVVPPLAAASPNIKLVARLIVWIAIWGIGAPVVVLWREHLPNAAGLILIQCGIAVAAVILLWKPKRQANAEYDPRGTPGLRHNLRALLAFWSNR